MTSENMTVDGIRKAAEIIRKKRPAYGEMLDFYENVFVAQHLQLPDLALPAIRTDPGVFAQRQKNGFPLMDPSEFSIDIDSARLLFKNILEFAARTDAPVSVDAKKLLEEMKATEWDLDTLLAKFEASDDAYLQDAAARMEIGKDPLVLILYHSIRPSLIKGAEAMSAHLPSGQIREESYCPICGTPAVLSVLDIDGRRSLICGYCWHDWQSKRVFCPFCAQSSPENAEYLSIDAEPEYRIDVCGQCKTYIKTVDERKMDRPLYPPLEAVCTLHLDMKAAEAGYTVPALLKNSQAS